MAKKTHSKTLTFAFQAAACTVSKHYIQDSQSCLLVHTWLPFINARLHTPAGLS